MATRKLTETEIDGFVLLNAIRESGEHPWSQSQLLKEELGVDKHEVRRITLLWSNYFREDEEEYNTLEIEVEE